MLLQHLILHTHTPHLSTNKKKKKKKKGVEQQYFNLQSDLMKHFFSFRNNRGVSSEQFPWHGTWLLSPLPSGDLPLAWLQSLPSFLQLLCGWQQSCFSFSLYSLPSASLASPAEVNMNFTSSSCLCSVSVLQSFHLKSQDKFHFVEFGPLTQRERGLELERKFITSICLSSASIAAFLLFSHAPMDEIFF